MRTDYLTLDIETGPGALCDIEPLLKPGKAPANYKDPEKIAAYLEEDRQKQIDQGALEATTGVILCVTVAQGDAEPEVFGDDNEQGLVEETLRMMETAHADNGGIVFVTFRGHGFDLPFLIRRAWRYGIRVPKLLMQRFMRPTFVDLFEIYQCGNRDQTISLDRFAKLCNIEGKNGDVEAKYFHEAWKTNRPLANEYARQDVRTTRAIARHIRAI